MSTSHNRRTSRRSALPRVGQRRLLRLERLCDRRVLATITGMVFEDANQTLRLDEGESGLQDRIVYVDLNQNGVPNIAESLQRTGADGRFQFDDLDPGDYVVRLFNGTQSQRQTYPVAPQLDEALLQIADVDIQATSPDGSFVYGLLDDSIVRIDHLSGDIQTIDIGGVGGSLHSLPDGTLLVLGDAEVTQTPAAWIVSFEGSTSTPIDFGFYPGEVAWSTAAVNQNGDGVLIAKSETGEPAALRTLSFEDGQLIATPTANELLDGSTALTNWDATVTLFAIPHENGLQLIQWSNSTGTPVIGTTVTVAGGVSLEAFDEQSGLAVVRDDAGELLVLDSANGYALLDRIADLPGPVVLDGVRDFLYGQDEDTGLVVYDLAEMRRTAVVPMPLPRVGGMTLVNDGNTMLLGGHYAVLRAQLDRPDAQQVELEGEEDSTDVLFGLFVQETNTAPEFRTSHTFQTPEDTPFSRPTPSLLANGFDADVNDQFIVLKVSDPNRGTVAVGPGGDFTYAPGQDLFGQDAFEILLHDGRSVSESSSVQINVSPVNDPIGPFVIDLPPVILENVLPGVPLGAIQIINVDVGEVIDIQVDDPRFLIRGGQLILVDGVELDFETESSIWLSISGTHTILAPDPADNIYEMISTTVLLQIGDANDAVSGVGLSSQVSVLENSPGTIVVGQVYAIDQDYDGDYSYEVDDQRFEVKEGYLQLKSNETLDYEVDKDMQVTITVTDGPFQASDKFTIDVLDVNEVITGISFAAETIVERVEGAVVGELQVDDPDQPTTAQLSVDDTRFEFVGTTLKLRDGVSVSFAEQQQIHLILTAIDDSETPFSQSIPVALAVQQNLLPFHNESFPLDVDGSLGIDPTDALLIINYLNQHGPGPIERPNVSGAPVYYDVNGDGMVTPLDVLLVINRLNMDNRSDGDPTVGGDGEKPQGDSREFSVPLVDSTLPENNSATEDEPAAPADTPLAASRKLNVASEPPAIHPAAIDRAVESYYIFGDDDEDEDEENLF